MRARRHDRGRTPIRAGVAAAALLLLSACGSSGTGSPSGATGPGSVAGSAAPTGGPGYAAPLRFGTVPVALPAAAGSVTVDRNFPQHRPMALLGTDVYLGGPDAMQVVNGRTGVVLSTAHPQGTVLTDSTLGVVPGVPTGPLVVAVGGSTLSLVLDAFVVTVPPPSPTPGASAAATTGPPADTTAVELVAVDGSTRQTVWTAQLTGLPSWAADPNAVADGLSVGVVGYHGNTAVVTLTDRGHLGSSLGIDLMTHQKLWQKDDFAASVVSGETVLGTRAMDPKGVGTKRTVAALALGNGDQRWAQWDVTGRPVFTAAGPGAVALTGTDRRTGTGFAYLVGTDDGSRTVLPDSGQTAAACGFDQTSALVCTGRDATGDHLYGLDAATGRLRWQLPDPAAAASRPVPYLTALWHGVLYGAAGGVPVLLDARTGAEHAERPGIAPVLVDGSTALAAPGAPGAGRSGAIAAWPAVH